MIAQSKLEQSQDLLKSSLAKIQAQNVTITDLLVKYLILLAEKNDLEGQVRILEDDNKVIKAATHLKTKYDLFKEFEQYYGSEWDLQSLYDAWKSYITAKDE